MAWEKSAIFCNHANECPNICPCDDDCYCKEHTCRSKPRNKKVSSILSENCQHPDALINVNVDGVMPKEKLCAPLAILYRLMTESSDECTKNAYKVAYKLIEDILFSQRK